MPTRFRPKNLSLKGEIITKSLYTALFFACLAVGTVFVLNRVILPGVLAGAIGVLFAFLWRRSARKVKRCKAGFCVCGEAIAYHDGVTHEKRSEWSTSHISGNLNEILTTTYANICIHYPCSNCGKVKEFKHMICIRETRKNTAGEILQERQYSSEQAICEFFDDLRFCRKQK